ncbi:MAG: hypothetical protein WBA46_05700 [Thermomicrobiales bacterium]
MAPRRTPDRERYSNRQAIVFAAVIVIGLAGGWLARNLAAGMMIGAVVGALAMLLPGIRSRGGNHPPTDPDQPSTPS